MQLKQTQYADLSDAVAKLKIEIDEAAGRARLRYITSVPGQEAVYIEKMRQAKAYLALPSAPATMDDFKYIEMEAAQTGATHTQAATRINQVATLWGTQISPNIESKRIGAKDELSALANTATIQDAVTIGRAAVHYLNAI